MSSNYLVDTHCHLHDREFFAADQAEEMLRRYAEQEKAGEETQPVIILKDSAADFFEMTIDDFEIRDYHPVKPQLKFELGI